MKNFWLSGVILACGITFSTCSHAESLSKEQYDAETKRIESEYLATKVRCISLSGLANEKCVADADFKKQTATTVLNRKYSPPANSNSHLGTVKIDSDYLIAIEKCTNKAPKEKDECEKTAKSNKDEEFENFKKQQETELPKPNKIML